MSSILAVMNDMAEAMTAVNASRRQIRGVAAWHDACAASVNAGHAAGAVHAGEMTGTGVLPGSETHWRWLTTAEAVILALGGHAAEAEALALAARERAANARDLERQAQEYRAQAEADENMDAAAAFAAQAAAFAREAEKAEARVAACDAWAVAANDAAAQGTALTAQENEIHAPVAVAVSDAGGTAWIAQDKHFLTMDGGA